MIRRFRNAALWFLSVPAAAIAAQANNSAPEPSHTATIMTGQVIPASDAIWGASELATDAEWQAVAEAARRLIAAGEELQKGGPAPEEQARAAEPEWQALNERMVEAARQILTAVEDRDEEALFNAGNDALYPPCAECHERYMPK